MNPAHSFHIPVMGISFTIDTPLKVAQFGIDSVISIGDDILLEKMRKMYCNKFGMPYEEIVNQSPDFRAKRITAYLNLVKTLAERNFAELKAGLISRQDILDYFDMLPDRSQIKKEFQQLTVDSFDLNQIKTWLQYKLSMGSIDVNVMTKLDKDNYDKSGKLPVEFNDAHAAVRGYANSELNSSIILSAGLNPRLFTYMHQFEDFHPDSSGNIRKKIVLKVSDYRSALIQGKFLAKKGLWVSEYRIESGLNCGGHAFATDGYLLGPILAEFKAKHEELVQDIHDTLCQTLTRQSRDLPQVPLPLKITVQGGVGDAEEHQFLINHFEVDSVGWGSPFLLVPEATTVDQKTLIQLMLAREEDLYLSNISPLGVPFNNLRDNTKDIEKYSLMKKGRPGSSCPKKFLALNKEFTDEAICTASRQYQHAKLKELDEKILPSKQHQFEYDKIVDKACICVGLGTSALLENDLDTKVEGKGVAICPGPNMAYFSEVMSLKEIIDHIYGRANMIMRKDRPNMFIKELMLYVEYLKSRIEEAKISVTTKNVKSLLRFNLNLKGGIQFYQDMFSNLQGAFSGAKTNILAELDRHKNTLLFLQLEIDKLGGSR